jgi:8-oxo-dGTP diphosphatase
VSLRFREKIQAMPRVSGLTARKIHVAAGILIDAEGRLLITDRSRASAMQEFWEFPGGKLASGESAGEALRRELVEELGIEITSCDHFHSLEHDYPEMRVAIEFFLVRKWQGTPSGIEGQVLRWLKPSQISPGELLPADEPVLAALNNL